MTVIGENCLLFNYSTYSLLKDFIQT